MYDFTFDHSAPADPERPDLRHVYLRAAGDQPGFTDGALYVVRAVSHDEAAWFARQAGVVSLSEPEGVPAGLVGRSILPANP